MTNKTKFSKLRVAIINAWECGYLRNSEKHELLEFIEELKEKVGFDNAE